MLKEIAVTLAVASASPATSGAKPRATEAFRAEHVDVRRHLAHITDWVGDLPKQSASDGARTMTRVVNALRSHIIPHAQWEDRVLYPLVDEKAGTTDVNRFTAVMRHEHVIVARSIDALAADAEKKDSAAFARRADRLLGLIEAHFECEEEVLLPILDRTMTQAEFDAAIQAGGKPH